MGNRLLGLVALIIAILILPTASHAQAAPQSTETAAPAPAHDVSGVWQLVPQKIVDPNDHESPGGIVPPMTAWAKELYEAEKPGYGRRAAPGGNDPILQCDPIGFPRIIFWGTPFEFIQIPGRTLQAFEPNHVVRVIWTDGRALPKNAAANPLWYGYSIGKWEDDSTFVIETTGLDDRTWLGAAGFPHSTSMVVEERYRRVDHDTVEYKLTMIDLEAYTKPWVGNTRSFRLKPHGEVPQSFCVYSEENSFAQRIRAPAAAPAATK